MRGSWSLEQGPNDAQTHLFAYPKVFEIKATHHIKRIVKIEYVVDQKSDRICLVSVHITQLQKLC